MAAALTGLSRRGRDCGRGSRSHSPDAARGRGEARPDGVLVVPDRILARRVSAGWRSGACASTTRAASRSAARLAGFLPGSGRHGRREAVRARRADVAHQASLCRLGMAAGECAGRCRRWSSRPSAPPTSARVWKGGRCAAAGPIAILAARGCAAPQGDDWQAARGLAAAWLHLRADGRRSHRRSRRACRILPARISRPRMRWQTSDGDAGTPCGRARPENGRPVLRGPHRSEHASAGHGRCRLSRFLSHAGRGEEHPPAPAPASAPLRSAILSRPACSRPMSWSSVRSTKAHGPKPPIPAPGSTGRCGRRLVCRHRRNASARRRTISRRCSAPRVVLTRAAKVDGVPTVPSRWLLRLQALVDGMGLSLEAEQPWLAWAQTRSAISDPVRPVRLPSRVRRWPSASQTQRDSDREMDRQSLRDLRAPHPGARTAAGLGEPPAPALRGQIIHEALGRFAQRFPGELPGDIARS